MENRPNHTQNRCETHGFALAEGERCRQCAEAKRAAAVTTPAAQVADLESAELDAEIVADCTTDLKFATFLRNKARRQIKTGEPSDWHAAAKLIAEATKLKYQALAQKDKVSARAHSRYLVEHEKDIKGLRRKGN